MKLHVTILPLMLSLGANFAYADLFDFPNFSSTAGLTLVGSAGTAVTGDGTVLRVTPAAFGQHGAAYSTTTVPLGAGDTFSTQFQFRFTGQGGIDPADGIVFVVGTNTTGLGAGGGGLGYLGASGNSVGIEFDTFNNGSLDGNSSNHVGIDENGGLQDLNLTNVYGVNPCNFTGSSYKSAGCMSNGDLWTVNITYDGTNVTVKLSDPSEGSTFTALNSVPIDLASILGQSTAFVGFTSGTGAGIENHDIVNWDFSNTTTITGGGGSVPEPASLTLLGTVLLGLGWIARRRISG